ncbi:hypothetical protein EZS27_025511 [termite gut metagenome]|uniref:Uncharacterized protein n=1 Tax=termite gut metagenome TaxID=433724 RepID=A0A5J4QTS3_9ZZZZ
MIQQFFRETACFSKIPSDTMSKATIISLYPYRIRFANHMIILFKSSNKTLPIIRTDTFERNAQFDKLLS